MTPTKNPPEAAATAVIYLRVSTPEQAKRGGEDEGFPAQRQACFRKAEELHAEVLDEFMDAGESAKTADRHEFQKMLAYVEEHHIQFVIVHKVDRFARNEEDVLLNKQLREHGARLVSAMENIDDTPAGKLMHTMLSGMSQYYIDNLALEVMKGLREKVSRGGTPFRAPLGYLNIGKLVDGREARTVALDPDRAAHISWLFEQYATGEWSYRQLANEVSARGLAVRATPSHAERPIGPKQVQSILQNPYYTGCVEYQGIEYQDMHQALVKPELFATVQERIEERHLSSECARKHWHHLTGTIKYKRCGCGLVHNVVRGRSGERYAYFTCIGRLTYKNGCDLPYLRVEDVEEKIEELWRTEQIAPEDLDVLRADLGDSLTALETKSRKDAAVLDRQLSRLEAERERWAVAALDESVPRDIARRKQAELVRQRETVIDRRAEVIKAGSQHRENLERVLTVISACGYGYLSTNDVVKRRYNQAWFERIDIDDTGGEVVLSARRQPVPESLTAALRPAAASECNRTVNDHGDQVVSNAETANSDAVAADPCWAYEKSSRRSGSSDHTVRGSKPVYLAPPVGLEPTTL